MSGYKIVGFKIIDFKGIEIVQYVFKDGKGLVVVGDHGEGKSNVIEAINVLLEGAKALKKVDNPVHCGAKKYKITADFKGDGLACYDVGNLFRIAATQSINGKQQLKIENLENGKPIKASVRDILKTLRGLYVDPHQLLIELEEYNGDKKLAATVLKNIGLDLSEFEEKEEQLATQWSADNEEVDRNLKVLESIEKPLEGFPETHIDIDNLWQESANYKEFSDRNQGSDTKAAILQNSLEKTLEKFEVSKEEYNNKDQLLKTSFESIKQSEDKLFAEQKNGIEDFQKISNSGNEYKQIVEELENSIEFFNEKLEDLLAGYKAKCIQLQFEEKSLLELKHQIEKLDLEISEIKSEIGNLQETEEWTGLKDETGELTPDKYITKLIKDATDSNALFAKKEEREKAKENLEASKRSRTATDKLRKENLEARTQIVARSDFQVDGLSVNENGVLTAKVDGRPIVTLKDLNHADKLRVLSEILMVNNAAPLKLIVIKEGYACKPEYQKIIFDTARKHGHTAIMESFIELKDEGCLWMKDGISSDTPPVDLKKFEDDSEVTGSNGPDWG